MTALERYKGQRIGILGLAKSGLAAARAFAAAGAEVLAFDDKAETVAAAGWPAGTLADVPGLTLLVPSPGVPLTHPAPHPVIAAAKAAGVPVRGDVDLFAEILGEGRAIVGITGTNGKSTTTALVHHLLVAAGVDAVLGGNIGRPVFELDPGPEGRVFVLELSSFQLDLCEHLRCRVAAWLNLTPDHLDRHGDLEGYIAAKVRIFENQLPGDVAVVGLDDEPSREVAYRLGHEGRRVIGVSLDEAVPGEVEVAGGRLIDAMAGTPTEALDLRALDNLRGRHNWQNVATAYAVVRALGLPPERAILGLPSFKGLPHRMEEVARAGSVLWVNDSKATNPDSAMKSLSTYADVFWIAGGKPKPGGFKSLRPFMRSVRKGYLIGTAAPEIAADLGDLAPMQEVGTLEAAVAAASRDARAAGLPEAVVLLAPACASFDQFRSFEHRGDVFRDLARNEIGADAAAEARGRSG
jgi:UDP-N-acetylmuramoylalanine--D-glutamate ligase